MIPRYAHPTVEAAYADRSTYDLWLTVERATLIAQINQGIVPDNADTQALSSWLAAVWIDDQAANQIRAIERDYTHHDVAAFLTWLRKGAPHGQWIHFGLTSSDVVDTAQAMRFRELHRPMLEQLGSAVSALVQLTKQDQPMLGITHGQPAEPTSLLVRAWHWLSTCELPASELSKLTRRMQTMKLSGPVGTFAHNPPSVEAEVAVHLELLPMGTGSSQVVPRSTLAMWASTAAQLLTAYSKIALDLRLLATAGEVFWPRTGKHVGSSAMPHKNNPIEAEQMCGFAKMARGYAAMLQEFDSGWLERDIAHSSVERVAVPDLWHLVFTATERMVKLIESMELRPFIIENNLAQNSNAAWSHKVTLDAIRDGMGYTEAREYALEFDTETYDVMGDARKFTEQFPAVKAQ
jgi:adenylosuccinate lyase